MSPVISLQASWQQQRQQRQQALAQRQQQVRVQLDRFQKTRQDSAIALRQTLQQFQVQLQQDTQDFLSQVSTQRQEQAMQLTQQLCRSTQLLRQQTAELLSMQTADRALMAQQLFQELGEFHASLIDSTALLRKNLQQQIQLLRTETQGKLQAHRQVRIQNQIEMMQELSNYVEVLHFEVQVYLADLAQTRQVRSQQVQQELQECRDRRQVQAQQTQRVLQECRDRRLAETEALFQHLGEFRAELRAVYAEVRRSVWGEINSDGEIHGDTQLISQPIAVVQPKSLPKITSSVTSSVPVPATSPATSLATHLFTGSVTDSAPALVKSIAPVKPVTPVKPAALASAISLKPANAEASAISLLIAPTSAIAGLLPLEQQIYRYIEQTQGARLTDIETALGISRFQAVDTLRSLIKQGLVIQRNRLYLLQSDRLQNSG